jgi:SAM-dependent methyltransferase
MATNLWPDSEHALRYLARADKIPHRTEGEGTLLDLLPEQVERFVDLGCGDGRLTALVLTARPDARAAALDFSPPMLAAARERFADDDRVTVIEHDLHSALPLDGPVDAVVSSFAIHHVTDDRKRSIDDEVFAALRPGGVFLNLEHVASPTPRLHDAFLAALGTDPADDDPSNQLAPVDEQLAWLRQAGFDDVDCHWKWRELALLAGVRPGRSATGG